MYVVRPSKQKKWKAAVDEAVSMQNKTVQERFDFFFNMFATKKEKKKRLMGIAENAQTKTKSKVKVKQEDEDYVPPRKIEVTTRLRRSAKLAKPEVTPSECSLSDTDTSSKLSVNSTNSLEAQAALYKRNNILKGACKGRVCEICEKPDDVLKCKSCFGYFHAACATKGQILKENEEKIDTENNTIDLNCKTNESSTTNSPRSGKSVEFRKLTLAEQIDLKMKEIMKKFDYKSIYADSTSDSASSDESGPEKSNNKVSVTIWGWGS